MYLGLGTGVVFLLGYVLPALGLGSRDVVGNGHCRALKRVTAGAYTGFARLMSVDREEEGKKVGGFFKKKRKSDLLCARWASPRPRPLLCVCRGCGGGGFGCGAEAVAAGCRLKTNEDTPP